MTLKEFLSDRLGRLALQPVSMAVMTVFLLATGTQAGILIILLIVWFLLFLILQAYDFLKLRSHLDELKSIMDGLDQKHLFSECVPKPHNAYERRIYQLMRRSGKAMMKPYPTPAARSGTTGNISKAGFMKSRHPLRLPG